MNLDDLIEYYVDNEIPFTAKLLAYSETTQSEIHKVRDCYMSENHKGVMRVVLEHR